MKSSDGNQLILTMLLYPPTGTIDWKTINWDSSIVIGLVIDHKNDLVPPITILLKFQLPPPKRLGTVVKNILGGHHAPHVKWG